MALPGKKLAGRVALVSGGSKGIGLHIARALGSEGALVAICARNRDRLFQVSDELSSQGVSNLPIPIDLRDPNSAKVAVEAVTDKWRKLDILVNNAGGLPQTGRILDLTDEAWMEAFQLNFFSVVRLCREAIPHLKQSPHGRIINLSSIVAKEPGNFNPHYSAAKAAVHNLTKHLAGFLASDRILVNCISPGIIETEAWDTYIQIKAEQEGKLLSEVKEVENLRAIKSMPLGRLGQPDEIAQAVLFLAGDSSSFITGADLVIDGGKTRAI
jgi:NAD(P)-dependent dehydrogenase (short-subunit alcohol dehydrogenase family)